MIARTKLLIFLSGFALVAVAGFLFGPALFPGLDPSEEVSKGSDAKIEAQDSGSGSSSGSECTYSDAGDVRTVFADGAELLKFHGDHRIEIEAPLARSDRSAVTTYADGTVRVETYRTGTLTRQMVYRVPLKVRWFKPGGDPRSVPEPGTYPDLWDKVEDIFSMSDPNFPIQHPWDDPDLGGDWQELRPPGDIDDEEFFGPIRRVVVDDDGITWVVFRDRTVRGSRGDRITYSNRGRMIWVDKGIGADGLYLYEGEDEGHQVLCPEYRDKFVGDLVKQIKIRYGDGVVRQFFVRSGADVRLLDREERYCEVWKDSSGRIIDPRDPDGYPFPTIPDEFMKDPPSKLFQE